jgi:RNA polymerase sigma-70 factor, ECF subfamily
VSTEIERLYREHHAGLVRLVERELRDHHDAEDVVQTAFIDAQRAIERGTVPRNPHAWLAAIALNAARRLRRRQLNAELLEDYAVQEASGMADIRAALTSLPHEQRAAVLYRDVLGLSYGETAEQMGTSVNAVTMLLHRGRKRLRESLGVVVGGVGFWRWLKQAGTPQPAVAKGAAAVVAAAGLAAGGIVVAGRVTRAVGPPAASPPVALPAHAGTLAVGLRWTPAGAHGHGSARRPARTAGGSKGNAAGVSTQGSGGDAAPAPVGSTTAGAAAPVLSGLLSRARAVRVPPLKIPALPATVTVSTPIATATVSIPIGTTATVTTPLTTLTLPLP